MLSECIDILHFEYPNETGRICLLDEPPLPCGAVARMEVASFILGKVVFLIAQIFRQAKL